MRLLTVHNTGKPNEIKRLTEPDELGSLVDPDVGRIHARDIIGLAIALAEMMDDTREELDIALDDEIDLAVDAGSQATEYLNDERLIGNSRLAGMLLLEIATIRFEALHIIELFEMSSREW